MDAFIVAPVGPVLGVFVIVLGFVLAVIGPDSRQKVKVNVPFFGEVTVTGNAAPVFVFAGLIIVYLSSTGMMPPHTGGVQPAATQSVPATPAAPAPEVQSDRHAPKRRALASPRHIPAVSAPRCGPEGESLALASATALAQAEPKDSSATAPRAEPASAPESSSGASAPEEQRELAVQHGSEAARGRESNASGAVPDQLVAQVSVAQEERKPAMDTVHTPEPAEARDLSSKERVANDGANNGSPTPVARSEGTQPAAAAEPPASAASSAERRVTAAAQESSMEARASAPVSAAVGGSGKAAPVGSEAVIESPTCTQAVGESPGNAEGCEHSRSLREPVSTSPSSRGS
jgi:hypothetical protein